MTITQVNQRGIAALAHHLGVRPEQIHIVHGGHYGLPILMVDANMEGFESIYAVATEAERKLATKQAVTEYFDDVLPVEYHKYFDYDRLIQDVIENHSDASYLSDFNKRRTVEYMSQTYYIYKLSTDMLYRRRGKKSNRMKIQTCSYA